MDQLTEKQNAVLHYLVEYTNEYGYPPTVRELCDELGLKSPNSAHFHLKALKEKGYIRVASGKNRGITVLKPPPGMDGTIPVVGRIAAGVPILAVEHVVDSLSMDRAFFGNQEVFSVRVHGDSMVDAHIQDGDYVVIRVQNVPKNGDIVAALVDDEVTLKYFYKNGDRLELRPANEKYEPFVYTPEDMAELRILGVMVGLVRRV
ncbi:MAG: transcriptional repressor LexA [Desulfatibacillaceae bacterium]